MIRSLEIILCLILVMLFIVPSIIICFLIMVDSSGSPIHFSKRIGVDKKIFFMPKFRTMKKNSPQLATDLIDEKEHLTRFGSFLRKYSIDEIPQIFSILNGDMTFVGPRPALFNQFDLIEMREVKGINKTKPGITGYAQTHGRDEVSIERKIQLDEFYIKNKSIYLDIKIIFITLINIILKKNVSH